MASDATQKFRALVGAMFPTIWAPERAKKKEELQKLERAATMGGHGFNPSAVFAQLEPITNALQAALLAIIEKLAPLLAEVSPEDRVEVFRGVEELLGVVTNGTLSHEAGRLRQSLLFRGHVTLQPGEAERLL